MPAPKNQRPRTTLPQLFKELAGDGVRVAEAELALSRAELAALIRSYAKGIATGAVAVAVLIVALTIFAQGLAIALVPFLASATLAYFCVGAGLAVVTIGLALISIHMLKKKHEPIGLIFKWLSGAGIVK